MFYLYDLSINASTDMYYVDGNRLRFGWKLCSDEPDTKQKSYRLKILSDNEICYDSGVVITSQSTEIEPDIKLASRSVYTILVEVTDSHGNKAEISREFATVLYNADIIGKWIKPVRHIEGWAPYIRTKFEARKADIARATLYVSGLGCGEYYINGEKITEDYIDPPFTDYEKLIFYRAYDIKQHICDKNCFAVLLGEGWYSQSRVWGPGGNKYGDCCLWAQLEIEYSDGSRQIIATDENEDWKYKYSPIVLNNLYGGETYDTRLETPDFAEYDSTEEEWGRVIADTVPKGSLTFCYIPAVRIIREIPAVSVRQVSGRDDGAWIVDMGENFAGFARFNLPRASRGSQYVFRFAETVNPDGSLDFRSIGSFATQCIQQDIYIARGDIDGEAWQPRFTYHAFRYIEITGYHDIRGYGMNPDKEIVTGYAISTDLRQTGSFVTSDDDINRLNELMLSTFRSNYHGFPEDCPGREKGGWLGDAQIVCNYGIYNFDLESCYEKYMTDIRVQRDVAGTWQMIAPGKRTCGDASPLWGCAQIIIPYWMYRYYGDRRVVLDNWQYMKDWVEHENEDAKDFIITRGLGDWCPPGGHETPTRIPVPESSTAMYFEICIRMAELCKDFEPEKTSYYSEHAEKIKCSFNRNFWIPDKKRYSTAGTCGVALLTGLYPEGQRDNLISSLLELLKEQDYAMTTGIYGNKYLMSALCECGKQDIAYNILFNPEHPSFKTMMMQGATSLWEAVEMVMVGTARESGTASYNHPMHSGFAYMFYEYIAGIRPLEAGFSRFAVAPVPFEKVGSADVKYECPYGEIAVAFERKDGRTHFSISVPCGTQCHFSFGGVERELQSGQYELTV